MADFLDIRHEPFEYIFVPARIEEPVEVRRFSGKEGEFQKLMKAHFQEVRMTDAQKAELVSSLAKQQREAEGVNPSTTASFDLAELSDSVALSYQIIPLTVPTKDNGYTCLNAYIDNVGRIKGMPLNVRASRVTSDDIRGDCFISRSFDNEIDFKRVSITEAEFEDLLAKPPSKEGRWDPTTALQNAKNFSTGGTPAPPPTDKCANCFKTKEEAGGTFKRCGKCRKVLYCGRECQVADWRFHKRVCV